MAGRHRPAAMVEEIAWLLVLASPIAVDHARALVIPEECVCANRRHPPPVRISVRARRLSAGAEKAADRLGGEAGAERAAAPADQRQDRPGHFQEWIGPLNAAGAVRPDDEPRRGVRSIFRCWRRRWCSRSSILAHGPVRMTGFPVKLSATPAQLRRPAPAARRAHGSDLTRAWLCARAHRRPARTRHRRTTGSGARSRIVVSVSQLTTSDPILS